MLDELNLASDPVLQAIESFLHTGKKLISDASSTSNAVRVIKMHPKFRLFATQNPSSGFFKHMRQPLSTSFLSRFQPLEFCELPQEEWVEVVTIKLQALETGEREAELRVRAAQMVKLHVHMQRCSEGAHSAREGDAGDFPEHGPYASVSIRELLKFVSHLQWCVVAWLCSSARFSGALGHARTRQFGCTRT